MNIKYKDITLRAIEEFDLPLVLEMINDSEIERMTGGGGFPVSIYQQKKWYEMIQGKNDELRLMIDTADHVAVGLAMLTNIDYKNGTAELHVKLATSLNIKGKGFGTKAYIAIINYAFDMLNLNCIYTGNIEYNKVTEHIKQKIGFIKEAVLRERVYKYGRRYNIHVWSLLRNDWESVKEKFI